jgi:hypothetical protein
MERILRRIHYECDSYLWLAHRGICVFLAGSLRGKVGAHIELFHGIDTRLAG